MAVGEAGAEAEFREFLSRRRAEVARIVETGRSYAQWHIHLEHVGQYYCGEAQRQE